jgi:hypothetical protein
LSLVVAGSSWRRNSAPAVPVKLSWLFMGGWIRQAVAS